MAGGDDETAAYEQPALNNEINVVPMCDIMLVMLIIFMLVTPTILQGFQATLPVGDNLLERPEDDSNVVVGIDTEGNWYFNKKPIAKDIMLQTVQAAFAEKPEDKVLYIKAHADLPYREIMYMMDLGREAGALVMAAVSENRTPEGGS